MGSFWNALTAPQATVIAGGLTFAGAVFGVLLASFLLGGRVKNLDEALEAIKKSVANHGAAVEGSLVEIRSQFRGLVDSNNENIEKFETFVVSHDEQLGQLRGQVGDTEAESNPAGLTDPQINLRELLKTEWAGIRDKLETIAANTDIDWRTRAKYWRIDRRSYLGLVDALAHDGKLDPDAKYYREAAELWNGFRNGRQVVAQGDVDKMIQLRGKLEQKEMAF